MERIKIKPRQLYQGCILAAIIHAVTVGEYPELNYEHSWNGFNYCMDNSNPFAYYLIHNNRPTA